MCFRSQSFLKGASGPAKLSFLLLSQRCLVRLAPRLSTPGRAPVPRVLPTFSERLSELIKRVLHNWFGSPPSVPPSARVYADLGDLL